MGKNGDELGASHCRGEQAIISTRKSGSDSVVGVNDSGTRSRFRGEAMALDLALVMPVFNEEECIADVVRSWLIALADLKIQFRMMVLNDGSYDATKEALSVFAEEERIEIVNKENSGHGPTILIGYNKAVQIAEWVFQCDSDDEMKPEHFANLWKQRQNYDALFGIRTNRKQNLGRKLISICSRKVVRLLFGTGVSDVNTPYRLIRSVLLKQIINHVPSNSFAPNIMISGALCKGGARVYEYLVPHESRKTGSVSIIKWKLVRSSIRAFCQTLWWWICFKDIDCQVQKNAGSRVR
jgi:glycosyltransferase involved in cell wall biosynthesis